MSRILSVNRLSEDRIERLIIERLKPGATRAYRREDLDLFGEDWA